MIYLQLRGFLSLLYNTVFIYSPKTSCSVCMLSQNLCYLHSAKFLMATIFKVNADFKAYSNVCLQHCEFQHAETYEKKLHKIKFTISNFNFVVKVHTQICASKPNMILQRKKDWQKHFTIALRLKVPKMRAICGK